MTPRLDTPNSVIPCPPLQWPNEWLHPTPWMKMSIGLPWIGLDKRVHKQIADTLRMRNVSCLKQWPDVERVQQCRNDVAHIVQEYFYWPNNLFIPEDPCEILFWDPSTELRFSEAVAVMCDKYHVNDTILVPIQGVLFGQLITILADSIHP